MDKSTTEISVGVMSDLYRSVLNERYGESEARAISRVMFQEILGLDVVQLQDQRDRPLLAHDRDHMEAALVRLLAGEPMQYVLGRTWFMGMHLEVDPAVLIPRPETEEMVQMILDHGRPFKRILDVGTGSGCIAIGLKRNLPFSMVRAIDVSPKALAVAKRNGEAMDAPVEWERCDVLEMSASVKGPFDLIVSNPPYVPRADEASMSAHVLGHEPHLALFVEDEDPLQFYAVIAQVGLRELEPNGMLWFEGHHELAPSVGELLKGLGYRNVTVIKDLSGADRFICAER